MDLVKPHGWFVLDDLYPQPGWPDRHQANVDHLIAEGATVTAALLIDGEPAEALVDTATDQQADLIVLGRKHKSAWTAALAGSVSDMVSHASPIDVLIAR